MSNSISKEISSKLSCNMSMERTEISDASRDSHDNTNTHTEEVQPTTTSSVSTQESGRKRKEYWKHFTQYLDEDGKKRARCNYCPKISYACNDFELSTLDCGELSTFNFF